MRPIRATDALVVFPSTVGISLASQRKAKLLVGRDVERYFQLQANQNALAPAHVYYYTVKWERRFSDTFMKVMNKVDPGRRVSLAMDVDDY